MSAKEWMTVGLVEIIANPLLFAIFLIIGAVLFLTVYLTLAAIGLVSAIAFAIVAWLLVVAFGKTLVKKHPMIVSIVPLAFIVGLIVDHTSLLSFLSVAAKIDAGSGFGSMSFMDSGYIIVVGPYMIAIVALIGAVAILALTVAQMKNKYKWVK